MRVAILADIHGNQVALEAALAQIGSHAVDEILCLGDVVVLGPQPLGVLQTLRANQIPVIMGNTDDWLLNPQPWDDDDEEIRQQVAIELWSAGQLAKGDRDYVRTFVPRLEKDLGFGRTLLCYHGTPDDFNGILNATTPEEELETLLGGHQATIMAGGHTHQPMLRRFRDMMLLNPGSVGLPYLTLTDGRGINPTWAEYALIDSTDHALAITLERAPYRLDDLIESVQSSTMPFADAYLQEWWPSDSLT